MTTHYLTIKASIKNGMLQTVKLPADVADAEVEILISLPPSVEVPETQEVSSSELRQLLHSEPKTVGELLASGLVGSGAESMRDEPDTPEYIEKRRQQRRERRGNWTQS